MTINELHNKLIEAYSPVNLVGTRVGDQQAEELRALGVTVEMS